MLEPIRFLNGFPPLPPFSSTALIGKPVITQFLVERVQIAPLGGKKARLSHEN